MSRKERIFLDSGIIIGLFSGDDDAEKVLGGIISQSLCINDVVFSEVVYKSMALKFLETEEKFSLKKLKRNIDDALIAATCKHYGIKKIATFDPDFKRVDFLEVVELEVKQ
ncbi:MAG: PIN domain-containing protein [Candidatus Methanospirareceae archaeon]